MRRTIAGIVACGVTLIAPSPAAAAPVIIPNACFWTGSNTWEQENLTFAGAASPDRASAGAPVTLGALTAGLLISPEVVAIGYRLGVLRAGENPIAIRAWIAVSGANTVERVRVLESSTTARTTIVADANGEFVSATPIDVQAALPDTQWTTGPAFPTTFTQAEAGSLRALPVGPGDTTVTPKGSVFVVAGLGTLSIRIDCQPGTRAADRSGPVPAPGVPFASVLAPDAPAAPVATPRPALTLRSTKLRATDGRIKVKLGCAAAACAGTLNLQTASKVTVGKRRKKVTVTRRANYALAAGTSKTLTLKLTADARSLLRKRSLVVRVTTTPTGGAALSRKLTLIAR